VHPLLNIAEPTDSIAEVIERMQIIDKNLPSDDGVAYFNRVYMKVTEEVGSPRG
jgi:hypothetical protein